MSDPTEQARRELVAQMPAELQAAVERGEEVLTTDEMRALYAVEGFAAPFVLVRRKADGQPGSLLFQGSPRFYFGFEAAEART